MSSVDKEGNTKRGRGGVEGLFPVGGAGVENHAANTEHTSYIIEPQPCKGRQVLWASVRSQIFMIVGVSSDKTDW